MSTKGISFLFLLPLMLMSCLLPWPALSEEPPAAAPKGTVLLDAALCEEIKDYQPCNRAVVFPARVGKVMCYTMFDPVQEKGVIYHHWYHRDNLKTKRELGLHPPRWSCYSRISIGDQDKGPWRVEVTDRQGNLLAVLRFSVTD